MAAGSGDRAMTDRTVYRSEKTSSLKPRVFAENLIDALVAAGAPADAVSRTSATTFELNNPANYQGETVPSVARIKIAPNGTGSKVSLEVEVDYSGFGAIDRMMAESIFSNIGPQMAAGLVRAVEAHQRQRTL